MKRILGDLIFVHDPMCCESILDMWALSWARSTQYLICNTTVRRNLSIVISTAKQGSPLYLQCIRHTSRCSSYETIYSGPHKEAAKKN